MIARSLTLQQFRNIEELALSFDPHINVFWGENGQGKTNLLEAVWLFTGNPSFRAIRRSELIRWEQKEARLTLTYEDSAREQSLTLSLADKKRLWHNQVPIEKSKDGLGLFFGVIFSPQDLELIKGNPKSRRRFLDIAIGQLKPRYRSYLEQYEKIVEQRNALLKEQTRFTDSFRDVLDIWDLQLAKLGTILTSYRQDYVFKFSQFVHTFYEGLSRGKEELSLSYESSVFGSETIGGYETKYIEQYYAALQKEQKQDFALGHTGIGVHRDDLVCTLEGRPIKTFGSQGQQRSAALAMKLAEAEVLKRITGEEPVLLLDDVMSELDPYRQEYIMHRLKTQQVFFTCCDPEQVLRLRRGKSFCLQAGRVIQTESK